MPFPIETLVSWRVVSNSLLPHDLIAKPIDE